MLTEPLTHYRVRRANITDRTNPSVFQGYLETINTEIAQRLRLLGRTPPAWADRRSLRRLAWHYAAIAKGHA